MELHKKEGQEFGFSVRGEAPVLVAEVDQGSIAQVRTHKFSIRVLLLNKRFLKI